MDNCMDKLPLPEVETLRNGVLRPPEYYPVERPVIFLNGPIQGAPDWQAVAAARMEGQLLAKGKEIIIASPRQDYKELGIPFDKYRQIDWETHYRRISAASGLHLFWLASEEIHDPERAYAQISRCEIFESKGWHEQYDIRLVIGIEEGFSGETYLRRRFSQDCPDVPIFDNLEETCDTAVWMVNRPRFLARRFHQ
jgi:hypothetical protein